MQVHDLDPIHQVLAELAGFDERVERTVRGGDDADIDAGGDHVAADRIDLAAFEKAQEQRLHAQARLTELVEEYGAAVRELEAADLVAVGAGKAALHVSEQLRFEERLGNRGAVDRNERS